MNKNALCDSPWRDKAKKQNRWEARSPHECGTK